MIYEISIQKCINIWDNTLKIPREIPRGMGEYAMCLN